MTLATCSGARGPLLSQSWSKSKGGMFEILHLLFWKNVRRHSKNWSNIIKYIWKSSLGSELYRGISVFIPRRQENIKKQYRNKVEKWRVSEARPLILPSCMISLLMIKWIGHSSNWYFYKFLLDNAILFSFGCSFLFCNLKSKQRASKWDQSQLCSSIRLEMAV